MPQALTSDLCFVKANAPAAPNGGRPCDGAFPYFRVQFEGGGLTLAVGWPAQWSATFRGVPPPVVNLFGAQFITWRGIPIIPSDKVPVVKGKTKFILVRTGEERQGVVGLFQPGLVGEQAPGLSVRFTGIDRAGIASYLVTLYSSLAVLTDDALGVLDGGQCF